MIRQPDTERTKMEISEAHIDRWAQYWNACLSSGPQGLNFYEIKTTEDVALARKFCRVIQAGGLLSGYSDEEIVAASNRLRANIARRWSRICADHVVAGLVEVRS